MLQHDNNKKKLISILFYVALIVNHATMFMLKMMKIYHVHKLMWNVIIWWLRFYSYRILSVFFLPLLLFFFILSYNKNVITFFPSFLVKIFILSLHLLIKVFLLSTLSIYQYVSINEVPFSLLIAPFRALYIFYL
jgi:hypothetical protein